MRRVWIGALVCAAIVMAMPGCRPLETSGEKSGGLPAEALPSTSVIPASWGRLAGVSSAANYPDLVQLWFEDDSGVVRLAVFRVTTGELINARRVTRG